MSTCIDIGAYDAKTHFADYLKKAQSGQSFRITNRGQHIADLLPPGSAEKRSGAEAAERMQRFVETQALTVDIDVKALIEEVRD